jgi:hypothetical protein
MPWPLQTNIKQRVVPFVCISKGKNTLMYVLSFIVHMYVLSFIVHKTGGIQQVQKKHNDCTKKNL